MVISFQQVTTRQSNKAQNHAIQRVAMHLNGVKPTGKLKISVKIIFASKLSTAVSGIVITAIDKLENFQFRPF